jgi:hypothetical protein
MKKFIGAFLAVLLCLAGGVAAAFAAFTVSAAYAASTASAIAVGPAKPVALDSINGWHGQLRPRIIYIDGFGNVFLQTKWSRWSDTAAYGRSSIWVNTCTPDCAAGHYRIYVAGVTLWLPRVYHGVRYFSRLMVRYLHTYKRSYTYRWGCRAGAQIPMWIGGPSSSGQ